MPDQFTETKTTGLADNLKNSFKGVLFGLLFIVAAFGILYWNEGQPDLSRLAKTAVEINGAAPVADASLNGKLVAAGGSVNTNDLVGDNLFLQSGHYILVKRMAQMYSWKEVQSSADKKNIGGSTTNSTTYTYKQDWNEFVGDSASFKYPDGHENPKPVVESVTNRAATATVGAYSFDPSRIVLPEAVQLALNSKNTLLKPGAALNGNYIFINKGGGTFEQPKTGDLRFSYWVVNSGFNGTVFGALNNSSVEPYFSKNKEKIYQLFVGGKSEGVATFRSQHQMMLWTLRGAGFLLLWLGLVLLFGPIITLLNIVPFLGNLAMLGILAVTFLTALPIALIIVIVSLVIHSF